MTVDQVMEAVGDDPYCTPLAWRRTDKPSALNNHVQWAVYDVCTGNGQGGYYSYEYLSKTDIMPHVREMIENMNNRTYHGIGWPGVEHYRYTDWECGSIKDFTAWLKRSVGL